VKGQKDADVSSVNRSWLKSSSLKSGPESRMHRELCVGRMAAVLATVFLVKYYFKIWRIYHMNVIVRADYSNILPQMVR